MTVIWFPRVNLNLAGADASYSKGPGVQLKVRVNSVQRRLNASVVTQNRPMRVTSKPANEKARDIDSDGSPYRLLRYEQCLERSEETTSFGTREARMALAAHRASHWCTSRNSRRLPEGGGDRGTTTGWLGTASTGKTGQRGDHRPR